MSSRRSLVVAVVCTLISPAIGAAEPPSGTGGDPTNAARAGSWAHVDPQTGARIPARPPAVPIPADPALSTSHAGLAEKPAPGGGTMVDLQGRFRSAATADVRPDGTTHVGCHGPGAADRKE